LIIKNMIEMCFFEKYDREQRIHLLELDWYLLLSDKRNKCPLTYSYTPSRSKTWNQGENFSQSVKKQLNQKEDIKFEMQSSHLIDRFREYDLSLLRIRGGSSHKILGGVHTPSGPMPAPDATLLPSSAIYDLQAAE